MWKCCRGRSMGRGWGWGFGLWNVCIMFLAGNKLYRQLEDQQVAHSGAKIVPWPLSRWRHFSTRQIPITDSFSRWIFEKRGRSWQTHYTKDLDPLAVLHLNNRPYIWQWPSLLVTVHGNLSFVSQEWVIGFLRQNLI